MGDQLSSFIESLKSDRRIVSFDEASTKQAVVTRLLSLLGWDIFNIDDPNRHQGTVSNF
jgi:predicted type IV restriction endonuclease